MKKKYFLDTEFIEDGQTIDLISIGIIDEDNNKLYLGNSECDFSKADKWIIENVFDKFPDIQTNLGYYSYLQPNANKDFWLNRDQLKNKILEFIGDNKPEFWAYYADYDWVVFCQIFGKMIDLPSNFPMYCLDIKQYSIMLGDIELLKVDHSKEHDSLYDAQWTKEQYYYLKKYEKSLYN